MNGFTKLAFFPITVENSDAMPTYGSLAKIYSGTLTNNIKFEVTPNNQVSTRKADDIVEETEKMQNYSANLEVYGFDTTGLENILGYTKDANDNFIIEPNKTKTAFCVFFETIEANTGKRVQMYYYKVTLASILPSAQTDEKGDPVSTTLSLKGTILKVGGVDTVGAWVNEGEIGFVSSGMPSSVYSKAKTPTFSVVTFEPKDSSTEEAITGATIVVYNATPEVVEVETDGSYRLVPATYTYDISKTGYVSQEDVSLAVSAGDVTTGTKVVPVLLVANE